MAEADDGEAGVARRFQGLGWLSLGLGALALLAPRTTARLIGAESSRASVRALRMVGVREIGVGLGLLKFRRSPAVWTWLRVAGDVVDLSMLLAATGARRSEPRRLLGAMATVGGILALDAAAAVSASSSS